MFADQKGSKSISEAEAASPFSARTRFIPFRASRAVAGANGAFARNQASPAIAPDIAVAGRAGFTRLVSKVRTRAEREPSGLLLRSIIAGYWLTEDVTDSITDVAISNSWLLLVMPWRLAIQSKSE